MPAAHLLHTHCVPDCIMTRHHSYRCEPGMLAGTCYPSTWRVEARGPQVSGHPWLQSEFKASPGCLRYCPQRRTIKNKTATKKPTTSSPKNITKLGRVEHACHPSFRRQRQEDQEFRAMPHRASTASLSHINDPVSKLDSSAGKGTTRG